MGIDVAGKIKEGLQAEETLGVAADGSVSCTPEAEAKLSEQEKAAGDAAQGYFFEFFDTDKNPNMKLKMDAPLRKPPYSWTCRTNSDHFLSTLSRREISRASGSCSSLASRMWRRTRNKLNRKYEGRQAPPGC